MAVLTYIETDTGTNVDISAATAVGAYTSTGDKLVMCDVSIDAVAGNGDYVMYVTRQIGGAGSAYRLLPQTTLTAASGLTAISAQSGWITVRNGDVLTVYVDGLAGDTATPDWTTRWFEDSGTAGVAVASIATDAITAAAIKADAVTEIQSGLALEATLTAIKGAGWSMQTLAAIYEALSSGFGGTSVEDTINSIIAPLAGVGWTNQTLVAIKSAIDLLATAANLATLDGKADAILEDTGTTIPALLETIDNFIDTEVAAILEDTGTTLPATLATLAGYTDGIAGDVWSHAHRTLTNQGIDATSPASGDPLIIYRDTTVYISLTGLGDTTGAAATKIFFTAKENLEDADSDSIIQLKCTRATPITDPDTDDLLYINKAAPTAATEGTFVFADHTDGTAEITIQDDAAADLPIYAATPLYWDVKMVTAAGVSTILATGSMYIYGTPTRTIT